MTGAGAAASAGTPSEPFATSVAAPSPSTAAPSTDTTIRPGRRRVRLVRRAVRREPGRPAPGPPPGAEGPAAPTGSGSGRAAAPTWGPGGAGRSGPVAGAPQPGQARAPFR